MSVEIKAELSANVWKVLVTPGQKVHAEDTLLILECMKMEVPVLAPVAGTVLEVAVQEGGAVEEGATLLRMDA